MRPRGGIIGLCCMGRSFAMTFLDDPQKVFRSVRWYFLQPRNIDFSFSVFQQLATLASVEQILDMTAIQFEEGKVVYYWY